jgi:uncharacterized surface protein with fasciclin (FAS1) repeats
MKRNLILYTLAVAITSWAIFAGCKKIELKTSTTSDVNIVGYLAKHPDSFSLFHQILVRTDYAPFLNAYGSYTVFAPTNTGVRTWLSKIIY